MERLAERLRAAHPLVQLHPGDRAYTDPFHRAFRALYSPGWEQTIDALRAGDGAAIEPAIVFLEADPSCFRSGYEKERLCPLLSRAELSAAQRDRLLAVAARARDDARRPARERTRFQRMAAQLGAEERR